MKTRTKKILNVTIIIILILNIISGYLLNILNNGNDLIPEIFFISSVYIITPLLLILRFINNSKKKLINILILSFIAIIIISSILLYFSPDDYIEWIVSILAFSIIYLIVLIFIKSRFYNYLILGICIFFMGIVFKSMHWPGAGPLVILAAFINSIVYIFIAFYIFKKAKDNPFIKWYSLTINNILALQFIGFATSIMHWTGIIYKIGTLFFIVAVFSLIFTLPFSNYIDWSDFHKKIFYRTMLIPLGFVFILTAVYFVFPDFYQSLFVSKTQHVVWDMIFEK